MSSKKRIKITPPQNVEIMFVVDRSGSMCSMGSEVYHGFNHFVQGQCEAQEESNAKVYMSTIRFDTKVEVVHSHVPISKVPKATVDTFLPRSLTALFDGVLQGVQMMETRLESIDTKPKVIFVILTDGEENASTKLDKKGFKELLVSCKAKGWEFVFLAANQDAIKVGSDMGIGSNACMTFDPNPEACQATMHSLTSQLRRSVTVPESQVEFTRLERAHSAPSHSYSDANPVGLPRIARAYAIVSPGNDDRVLPRIARTQAIVMTTPDTTNSTLGVNTTPTRSHAMDTPNDFQYVLLSAACVHDDGQEKNMSVIVRFNSMAQLETEQDNFFDDTPDIFAQGLPPNWVQNDAIEVDRMVSEEEAKNKGFIVFKS